MRALTADPFLVSCLNLRPYLGTFCHLGANAKLTGQLIVATVLHLSFGSIHLFFLKIS